jgi:hypothetical protein
MAGAQMELSMRGGEILVDETHRELCQPVHVQFVELSLMPRYGLLGKRYEEHRAYLPCDGGIVVAGKHLLAALAAQVYRADGIDIADADDIDWATPTEQFLEKQGMTKEEISALKDRLK